MYEKILVPTDGSEGAEAAVEHAISLAEKYDAELHILYVADIRVDRTMDMASNLMADLENSGNEAVKKIQEDAEKHGIRTETAVVRGVPHMEINEYCGINEIDLVVMGTHGRTGLDRMLLGSVTEKTIRILDTPVLTVKRQK